MIALRIAVTFLLNAVWQVSLLAVIAYVCSLSLRRTTASVGHVMWVFALLASTLLPLGSLAVTHQQGSVLRAVRLNQIDAFRQKIGNSLWLDGEGGYRLGVGRKVSGIRSTEAVLVVLYFLFLAHRVWQFRQRWEKTRHMLKAVNTAHNSPRMIALAEECRRLLEARPVLVFCSTVASVPFTAGTITPVVVLPECLQTSSDDELRAAMAHEIAHVRRYDYLLNILCEVVSLPIAFHPCAWWMTRQIERTRETACDEIAARCLGSSTGYARALVNLASALPQPSFANAATGPALGVFDGNNLEERIMQLLDRTPRLNARAAGAVFAFSTLILFATCLAGYNFALAAGPEDAPGFVSSQDISGVWLGQLSENLPDGRVGHGSLYLRLQQSPAQVTGVAGDREATASPIENVVLSGKHLTFSVTAPGGSKGTVLWTVELDANGDVMEGKGHAFRSSDNHTWDVEIKLARNKYYNPSNKN